MPSQVHIQQAVEIVLGWELPDEAVASAVMTQAEILSGCGQD
jgi:hypothetical protein